MTSPSIDPDAFKAFELAAWGDDDVAKAYSSGFMPLTSDAIAPLLDAVEIKRGQWLLDIACGPGITAGVADERGVRTVGIDFSPAMVAIARQLHPALTFAVGDAEDLELPDATFDAAVMNFGLLHLARPEKALAEAARVLRPGGRFAFTVWARPEEAVAFKIVLDAVSAHGDPTVPLPTGPYFFRFSDEAECRKELAAAGFEDVEISVLPLVWRLSSPEALVAAIEEGTARSRGLLLAQKPEALTAIREAVRQSAKAYQRSATELAIPMPAVLASAEKPA